MIRFLKGKFHPYSDGTAVIETSSGIGFLVNIPANSLLYKHMEGEDVKVHTHMIVREDDMSLYGFDDREELKLRSEEHTSELQSRENLVCRLLLEKKKQAISF